MAILLEFPTHASPTASVTLPDCENLPASRPVRMRQKAIELDSGAVVVYGQGAAAVDVFTMALYPLTKTQADNILTFFRSTATNAGVNGRAKTWQLTDSRGNLCTVRFQMDVCEPIQRGPSTWAVDLTLREEVV